MCYPDRSVKAYSGLFLRLNEPGNAPLYEGREDLRRAPEPRIIFSFKAKFFFCRDAERDFRKPGGTFSRAMASMRLAWRIQELSGGRLTTASGDANRRQRKKSSVDGNSQGFVIPRPGAPGSG